jgi:hypothetical protein
MEISKLSLNSTNKNKSNFEKKIQVFAFYVATFRENMALGVL